ncbi:MAG: hypothetical protein ACKOWF_04810 [Chloroflexota bacterium]
MDTSEKQIKRIVLNRMERCSTCHHRFHDDDIQVLSRREDMWMMVVSCAECHGRNFVAAVLGDGDSREAQLALRQLGRESAIDEFAPGRSAEPVPPAGDPVAAADVLDMHEFLDAFDGDFQRLFSKT